MLTTAPRPLSYFPTGDTRPWIGFHTDLSTVTVNVALSADTSHKGGHLHAILEGKHQIVEREEGEATVHTDDVMHGVSAMRGGERCAFLILFFLFLRVLTTAPRPFLFPTGTPSSSSSSASIGRCTIRPRCGATAGSARRVIEIP